jgi:hypothetical protein
MVKSTTITSLLLLAAPALAQQIVVPPVFTTAEAGSTGNLWRAGTNRYQSAYDSSLFTGVGLDSPVYLHTLEFRLAGGLLGNPTTYPSVEVYLDYCVPDHATLNAAFASNRTRALPRTPEFAGAVDVLPASGGTPNDWVISVPLDTPFLYNPELGQDLLVEIVILGSPSPLIGNTSSSTFNVTTDKARATRSVGSTTATTGTLTAFAPVIRFGYNYAQASARHVAYGTGCYQTEQSFYEVFPGSAADLTGTTLTATKNAAGGYNVAAAPTTAFVAPTTTGLALTDDVVSTAITLPFTFDYAGGSTSSIFVDSNGRIFLNGTTASAVTATAPGLLSTPVHVICASWQDLEPDGTTNVANVFAEQNVAGNEFYVTWNGVECFGANDPSTFQVVFIDDGVNDRFELRYQTLFNNSTSNTGVSLTGFSLGGTALDPGASDLSAGGISTAADNRSLSLTASPRPVLGTTTDYTLNNIRANAGVSAIYVSFFGSSPTPLSAYGLFQTQGCFLHLHLPTATELGMLMIGSPSNTRSLSYPNDINFLGAQLSFQGLALAPLENGDGVITSNAIRSTLGLF